MSSFFQSMTTLPAALREAAANFRLDPWLRFKSVEMPAAIETHPLSQRSGAVLAVDDVSRQATRGEVDF
jgi:hypothetical protein